MKTLQTRWIYRSFFIYMNYIEKLKNPKWQKKRLEILNRDEFKCCYCDDTETELQIHHLKYTKEPWDVKNEHLITLCKHCHQLITFKKDLNVIRIIKHDYKNDFLTFFVKHKIDNTIFIEIINSFDKEYISESCFAVNGIGINNLISLNNG